MKPLDIAELTHAAEQAMGNRPVADVSDPFEALSRREWLAVNGTGGFASGTVAGSSARRYHALLVADLPAPYGRMALVGKVDEVVSVQGERFDLSTNRYPNSVVYPDGWRYVSEFTPFPVPTWTYKLPGQATLVKRIFLGRGKNTVYVTYTLREAPSQIMLTLTPLVCWKSYHDEMHPWPGFPLRRGPEVGGWFVQATADAPVLRLLSRGARWTPAGWWHERMVHDRERERGLEYYEDLFCPAVCEMTLRVGQTVSFVATVEGGEPEDATLALAEIVRHQNLLAQTAGAKTETQRDLVLASDLFVVRAGGARATVIAGYPWFTDWGRDAMIALPGLLLSTRRFDEARAVLQDFAGLVSEGMIPNRFTDSGELPDYNTADATLWFVHACEQYAKACDAATGTDAEQTQAFRAMMQPILETIVAAHQNGTRYGIGMDAEEGLLHAGEPGTQLTWMDAKVGDWVVTPRVGKPVEINALWINALRIVARFHPANAAAQQHYTDLAHRAAESFRAKFVRPDGQGLFDVLLDDGTPDASIRPNQVIAAALIGDILTDDEARAVLDVATAQLLTPYGLRSLAPSDSAYKGRYFGSPRQRDGAYHQGTVWAWLIGAYVDLYRRVHGPDADVSALITPLTAHLRDFGVGGLAEVFDGDAPHTPNGCPWQAWSIAEVLRVMPNGNS